MKENGVLGHFPCETSHLNKKHQFTVLKIFIKEYIYHYYLHSNDAWSYSNNTSKVKFLPIHAVFNSN